MLERLLIFDTYLGLFFQDWFVYQNIITIIRKRIEIGTEVASTLTLPYRTDGDYVRSVSRSNIYINWYNSNIDTKGTEVASTLTLPYRTDSDYATSDPSNIYIYWFNWGRAGANADNRLIQTQKKGRIGYFIMILFCIINQILQTKRVQWEWHDALHAIRSINI
jgi:hypothetical protein